MPRFFLYLYPLLDQYIFWSKVTLPNTRMIVFQYMLTLMYTRGREITLCFGRNKALKVKHALSWIHVFFLAEDWDIATSFAHLIWDLIWDSLNRALAGHPNTATSPKGVDQDVELSGGFPSLLRGPLGRQHGTTLGTSRLAPSRISSVIPTFQLSLLIFLWSMFAII